jgi:hypothetical protein
MNSSNAENVHGCQIIPTKRIPAKRGHLSNLAIDAESIPQLIQNKISTASRQGNPVRATMPAINGKLAGPEGSDPLPQTKEDAEWA